MTADAPPTGPLLAIVGPTATGKSDLAVTLACRLGGEVVNADASQLYRGLDIGTAKIRPDQRRGVRHHLLDVLDPAEEASVAAYQAAARAAIEQISARGALPILVGGSGLYVSAVLDPLVFPGTDPAIRARLEGELELTGAPALHARLAKVDPAAAAAIGVANGRRVVRALEVVELTGEPFTANLPAPGARPAGVGVLVLDADPAVLDRRIAARVGAMWAAGLVEEVRGLLAVGLREGRTAARALGYAQVIKLLDGDLTDEQARADTVRATRRFARRQRSWFRREATALRCDAAAPGLVAAAVGFARGLQTTSPVLTP